MDTETMETKPEWKGKSLVGPVVFITWSKLLIVLTNS